MARQPIAVSFQLIDGLVLPEQLGFGPGGFRQTSCELLSLDKFYGRDWPLALMAGDGNSQTVEFIEPNFFHCPGFAIGQYDAFAGQLCLRLLEPGKNCERMSFCGRHRIGT